jgi:hypothetical protein
VESILPLHHKIDVIKETLANLDKLNEAYIKTKPLKFAKGLPFHSCKDSVDNIWTKESPDGSLFLKIWTSFLRGGFLLRLLFIKASSNSSFCLFAS